MNARLTLRALIAGLDAGRWSALELAETALAKARHLDPTLHAFVTLAPDQAQAEARASDARRRSGRRRGLLDGIPYAAKDLFLTRGLRTTAGSRVLGDFVPDHSARLVEQLAEAGAVMLGKTNMHEFAYGATGQNGFTGTTTNPYDPSRLAGGSSGGSAAAVSSGVAAFALGTDTGGSVRVPAALCGVVGYKPSYDRLSLEGTVPFCWSLDHAGLIAGSVEDVVLLADVLDAVPGGIGAEALPARPPVIGLLSSWAERAEPAVRHGLGQARAILSRHGARFVEVELPDQAEARTVSLTLQLAEALAYHGPNLRRAGDAFGADIRSGLAAGQFLTAESYVQCQRMVVLYKRSMRRLFDEVDALLLPACPITAPLVDATEARVGEAATPLGNALTLYTSFFNLVGAPALVLPAGSDAAGLPVGVQIVGPQEADATVLALALRLERGGLGSDCLPAPCLAEVDAARTLHAVPHRTS